MVVPMTSASCGFELRDHTADIALYAWGDSLEALFRSAAEGFYATIGDLRVRPPQRREALRLEAGDVESLLHDFLGELLYRFETRQERLTEFTFGRLDDNLLEGEVSISQVDSGASVFDREVKAVTYHDLNILRRAPLTRDATSAQKNATRSSRVKGPGRYETTIILDI